MLIQRFQMHKASLQPATDTFCVTLGIPFYFIPGLMIFSVGERGKSP